MEIGELLKQFLIDLQALFRTRTKNLNLTLPQIMLISSIPTDGIDMTSLSQRIGVDNSTLTRLIGVLAKNRFVQKNNNPLDGRSTLVSLTESGEELQLTIETEIDRFGSELFHQIPIEDQEEMKEILSSFHWIVSKYRLNQ
ncbi:MAG: winged helix DNA-binding protein [Candidatus Marinimicrobia bacterium]|jgi:DNA-binding MarR family transcriptional regulator|nr:winged helix DNA-binding protein [Candidatus Neomarinimicrobiota bacterium]MDP6612316.1 winged helix DNA-binding protein [Candidatus Neomarinimicrobiota bacterium]|tara:strand:+ start:294 stop:716 length:423 start_codon:yes stop_codon:yes gene_type:complete